MRKNDTRLWEENVKPALDEMYARARNVFGTNHTFTLDEVVDNAPLNRNNEPELPTAAFDLDPEVYHEIIEKYTSEFKHFWKWPYQRQEYKDGQDLEDMKRQMGEKQEKLNSSNLDPESDEYMDMKWELMELDRDIKLNIEYKKQDDMWHKYLDERRILERRRKKKEITTDEYAQQLEKLATGYGCRWYSLEGEMITNTINTYCPDAIHDRFVVVKTAYNFAKNNQLDNMPDPLYGKFSVNGREIVNDDARLCVSFYNNLKKNQVI